MHPLMIPRCSCNHCSEHYFFASSQILILKIQLLDVDVKFNFVILVILYYEGVNKHA